MLSWSAFPAFIVMSQLLPRTVGAASSSSASTPTPTPLVVPPSSSWDGNDGPWSSFSIGIGTPLQTLRVLVSTTSNQNLVVIPEGCLSSDPSNCAESRGGIFQTNVSSSYYVPTWIRTSNSTEGVFSLGIDSNLGLSGTGVYGYDNVTLGNPNIGLLSMNDQLVGGFSTKDYFMGLFGVNPAATTFAATTAAVPSYLSSLKSQNSIPTLSYGYTAGNLYRNNKTLGSLTLGGYDASLFQPNDLTVSLSSSLEMSINVTTITMSSGTANKTLSGTSFSAVIDSTIAYLYLPVEVCQQFEDAFGIVYDDASQLYLVNDTLHTQLLAQNANVTFSLGNSTASFGVAITLPYEAFDLTASWPLVQNDTRYFPLKRATNSSQYTLGRTFLQEAYLIADYERSNFSVHQRTWDTNAKSDIQAINLPGSDSASTFSGHKKLSTGALVGIIVGATVILVLIAGALIMICQTRRKRRLLRETPTPNQNLLSARATPSPLPLMVEPPKIPLASDTQSIKSEKKSIKSENKEALAKDRKDIAYKRVLTRSPSLIESTVNGSSVNGSELDSVSTAVRSPEMLGGAHFFQPCPERNEYAEDRVHEMPARESVDWNRFAMKDKKTPRWI